MRVALPFLALGLLAPPLRGQAREGLRLPGLTYQFDVRAAAEDPDRLGLDFDVAYESARSTRDPRGVHYGLRVATRGFHTFEEDARDVNSIVGEVGLLGYYYHVSDYARIPPEMVVRYLALANVEPENLSEAQEGELVAIQDRMLNRRWFATFGLHYRYETDQTVTVDDHAFGAGVTSEVPVLAQLLDVVPALTRDRTGNPAFRPQPVRAFLGLDRVTGAEETSVGELAGDDVYWRARLQAAWATRILQGLTLRLTYEGHYLFGAGDELDDAGRDYNGFFQGWFLYPLSGKVNLMVKYLSGRLPPDYGSASTGKIGLTLMLQ